MNPKHHRVFKEGIAEKVGVHQNVVDEFVTFYFSKLRENLSNLTYPIINVSGLGTFHLRKHKLNKAIKKHKDALGNVEKRTYIGFERHKGIENKLESMEKIQVIMDTMMMEKKEFRENKHEK